jgi:hypothetical protein
MRQMGVRLTLALTLTLTLTLTPTLTPTLTLTLTLTPSPATLAIATIARTLIQPLVPMLGTNPNPSP